MNNKPLILIVDDALDNILTVKLTLKNEGYDFIEAANGHDAIELTMKHDPDVILMDAIMPLMDGFETTKILRKLESSSRTPILMISSLTDKTDKILALESGVNDFISKPFDRVELITRCKAYVGRAKLNKKYILASKNPYTNIPNKNALFEDLSTFINPKLLLCKIEDYELLEEFYSEEIATKIEIEFSKVMLTFFPQNISITKSYHTSEGEFVFIFDDSDHTFTDDLSYEAFHVFQNNIKSHIINLNGYEYDLSVILSYSYGDVSLFEHARVGLNYAIKKDKEFIVANSIINKVKEKSKKNVQTIKMIKQAIVKDNIVSYYQPIYCYKTKRIEKYESLVRLIDDHNKIIPPNEFLDVGKKAKYYSKITKKVIDDTLRQLETTNNHICINLSALDIDDRSTRIHLVKAFGNCPELSSRLTFELLEDEIFKNYDLLSSFISDAKQRGIKIAIDDFGTGYSNFERLQDFQPDILKIDGSLIKNIATNTYCKKIVETIHSFAQKINVKTVAEFVSDEEIFNEVKSIGIDYAQGYYIGKPKEVFI